MSSLKTENNKNTQASPLQQKHTALPTTVQFLLKREMWTPMLLMKGKVKGTGKMHSDPTMRMVLLRLCSFKQGHTFPFERRIASDECHHHEVLDPHCSQLSSSSPRTLRNSRAAWPQQGHTQVPPLCYFPVWNNMLILQKIAKYTNSVQKHWEECLMST